MDSVHQASYLSPSLYLADNLCVIDSVITWHPVTNQPMVTLTQITTC